MCEGREGDGQAVQLGEATVQSIRGRANHARPGTKELGPLAIPPGARASGVSESTYLTVLFSILDSVVLLKVGLVRYCKVLYLGNR